MARGNVFVPKLNIQKLAHLCLHLRLPETLLNEAYNQVDTLYLKGIRVHRRGKERVVNKPTGVLRLAQRRILDLLRQVPMHPAIVGGIPGSDNIRNAERHVRQRMVVCIDISRFFPSIGHGRVYHWFTQAGCCPDVARFLTRFVTLDECIPHGAITSTSVAALVSHRLAQRLYGLANQRGLRFTQYVDDFTFSGHTVDQRLIRLACEIIKKEGFSVQTKKTKVFEPGHEHVVTGVRVDKGIDVPTEYLASVKAELDSLAERHAQGGRIGPGELRRVRGKIAYVRRLNKHKAINLSYRHLGLLRF